MAKRAARLKPSREEILRRPSISPDELHKLNLMPVSRNAIYDACNRGEIECFRIGRKIIIPTAALRRKLGIEAASQSDREGVSRETKGRAA